MTGEELKTIRETAGLAKGVFAKTIGITPLMQGRYEGGKISIPDSVAEAVAKAYSPSKNQIADAVKEEITRLVSDFNAGSDEKFDLGSIEVTVKEEPGSENVPIDKEELLKAVDEAFGESVGKVRNEDQPADIKDKLKALGKNKQDLVFDDVKPILTDSFSFKFDGPANDPMTITAAELEQLKAAFDLQYKSEKKNGNAVQVTALKIFNAKVGIAWHSGGHSALPVITSAWGNGSERFNMGEYENTFISHTMKELVK